MYRCIQAAYFNDKGIWKNTNPDIMDVLATFVPVMNTLASLMFFLNGGSYEKNKSDNWITKLFKPGNRDSEQ